MASVNDKSDDTMSTQKNAYKDPDDGRQRFLLELEFVQCLANPTYIHLIDTDLAQNRCFEDEAFIGYLKYLQYWQHPESALAHPGNKELAHRQQFYFWKNYRNNRLKHILPRSLPESSAAMTSAMMSVPPLPLPPTNIAPPPPQAPSPMQYSMSSSSVPKAAEMRNPAIDRRKRK